MNSPLTERHYHLYCRALHWIMAALLFYLVFLGWSFDDRDTLRFARMQLHKSFGILVLFLTFVRIGLRFAYKAPPEEPMPRWQEIAAKSVHGIFYLLMIGLPLTGWAVVSTSKSGIPTELFGLIPWPHLPLDKALHEPFEGVHGILAKLLIYVTIPLHIGAALVHHFKDKDLTMSRMLPGLTPQKGHIKWLVPLLIIVLSYVVATFTLKGKPLPPKPETPVVAVQSEAHDHAAAEVGSQNISVSAQKKTEVASDVKSWSVKPQDAKITFATAYMGSPITGSLPLKSAKIMFSEHDLEASSVRVVFDLTRAETGDAERDETLRGPQFFDTGSTPEGIFEASRFEKVGENRYLAKGSLTLRGKKQPVSVPFSLRIDGATAKVQAKLDINRLNFGIGQGDFAAETTIPAKVSVQISLTAHA